MKRGPKPKPPELRNKFKNLAVDAEALQTINDKMDELEKVFGFRPTVSQALRHLLKKVKP